MAARGKGRPDCVLRKFLASPDSGVPARPSMPAIRARITTVVRMAIPTIRCPPRIEVNSFGRAWTRSGDNKAYLCEQSS